MSTWLNTIQGSQPRIGWPTENLNEKYHKELSSPIFSTAIGLMIHGIENLDLTNGEVVSSQEEETESTLDHSEEKGERFFGKVVNNLIDKTKEFFETKEDIEF